MARTLLSLAELKAGLQVTPAKGGIVVLRGMEIPWVPVTVAQYTEHVAALPSVQALYAFGAEITIATEQAKAGEEPTVLPDAAAFQKAQAQSALKANAAFLAISFGHPGNEELRDWIADCPIEELEVALDTVEYGSWGDDPERFFGAVARSMKSRPMAAMQAAAKREAATGSSQKPTPTPSTRTASKARTRTKPKPRARKPR